MLKKKVILGLLVVAVAIPLAGCGKKTMLTVNGEKVSKDEFYSRLERIQVQTPGGPKLAGNYVMEQIIGEKLVEQLAKKQGVAPTDAQIQSKIQTITKESGNLAAWLNAQGMTNDDLKKKLSAEQSVINLVSKGVTISDAEVKSAYDKELARPGSTLTRPEQVKFSVIVVEQKNKNKIDQAYNMLKGGAEFSTVAMQWSEQPNVRQTGGSLDWVNKDDKRVPAQVRQVALGLQQGQYSKPFQAAGGWVIVRLDDKRGSKTTNFDDIKTMVREQLAMRKGSANSTFTTDLQKFTKDANIKINAERYSKIPASIKKQAENLVVPGQKAPTATPGK